MRRTRLGCALLVLAGACSSKTGGPTPAVSKVSPTEICTAQADRTITITGTGFSPAVVGGLTDSPTVAMPQVFLVAADGTQTEIPASGVSIPQGDSSGTTLDVVVPQGLVSPTSSTDPAAVYDLRVVNPNGNEDTLAKALTIAPPPSLAAVDPTSGAQGSTVTVTLTGTGFLAGMTVSLAASPAVMGTNVTVASATSAQATFDLTGVAPGTYDITVTNADGCTATLKGAFTVYVPKDITITGIDPPFGCTCQDQKVTISSSGGFVSTPVVTMVPHGATTPVIKFQHVAFVDSSTLTAVVPKGAALGKYDVTVTNPPSDGGIGTLPNGFEVVKDPIPTIEAIVPSRGSPTKDTSVQIFGENFRSKARVELLDSTGAVAATVDNLDPVSATEIDATLPTNGMAQAAYLVRVTDLDEMTYSTFSNFIVADDGPSGNIHQFVGTAPLNTARRILAGVSARDDLGNHYLYAIGGDTGDGGNVLDSVEVSQLGKFGDISAWRVVPNHLKTPRVGAAAVAVPIFDQSVSKFIPVKTYLYVVGGQSDAGKILGSVERAVVLSSSNAPTITSAAKSTTAGTLAAGTWYYQVSAVLDPGDPDNPGGETLPSDEAIVTVGGGGSAIDLAWDPVMVNGTAAAMYNIYRTDAVNGVSHTEHLIATVDGSNTSYTDTGAKAGTQSPLPPGSTGVWTKQASALGTPRWGHQAALVTDNSTGKQFLFVVGGKSDNANGYLGSVEAAPVDASGQLGSFTTTGTSALSVPRAFFSLAVETADVVSGFTGVARFFALGGVTSGSGATGAATASVEISDVGGAGTNGTFTSYAAAPYNGKGTLQTRAGVMATIVGNKLFAMGGSQAATNTSFGTPSTTGKDIPFNASTGLPGSPIQSAANDLLPPGRALGAVETGSGFIYFIGGTSTGTNAVKTTERTF